MRRELTLTAEKTLLPKGLPPLLVPLHQAFLHTETQIAMSRSQDGLGGPPGYFPAAALLAVPRSLHKGSFPSL